MSTKNRKKKPQTDRDDEFMEPTTKGNQRTKTALPKSSKVKILIADLEGELSNQKLAARAAMIEAKFDPTKVTYKTDRQKQLAHAIDTNTLIMTTGEAGTGKSFVAIFKALEMLAAEDNSICKIYLTKPAQSIPGESLGFLPGDVDSKMSVFVYSMKAIINEIIGEDACAMLFERGFIEILPLAFIRGCTWKHACVVATELQNCSIHTVKSIMTRIGEGSKLICDGDLGQIDIRLKSGEICGLQDAVEFLPSLVGVGYVQFLPEDCVRSEIVKKIVHAYRIREGKPVYE